MKQENAPRVVRRSCNSYLLWCTGEGLRAASQAAAGSATFVIFIAEADRDSGISPQHNSYPSQPLASPQVSNYYCFF